MNEAEINKLYQTYCSNFHLLDSFSAISLERNIPQLFGCGLAIYLHKTFDTEGPQTPWEQKEGITVEIVPVTPRTSLKLRLNSPAMPDVTEVTLSLQHYTNYKVVEGVGVFFQIHPRDSTETYHLLVRQDRPRS